MVSIRAKWKIEEGETTEDVIVTVESQTKAGVDTVYDKLVEMLGEPIQRRQL